MYLLLGIYVSTYICIPNKQANKQTLVIYHYFSAYSPYHLSTSDQVGYTKKKGLQPSSRSHHS